MSDRAQHANAQFVGLGQFQQAGAVDEDITAVRAQTPTQLIKSAGEVALGGSRAALGGEAPVRAPRLCALSDNVNDRFLMPLNSI
jgi:hypothetical protein